MIRGLYSAATGMLAEQFVQDALASNMANINTAGYKQDMPTFHALHEMALRRFQSGERGSQPVGDMGMGAAFDHTQTDFTAGPLAATGNPTDLALVGDGFFAVQTPQGERYTRAGQFHLQPAGKGATYLADDSGNRVLGAKGPINLDGAHQIVIDGQGNVQADGKVVERLKLVSAPTGAARKQGANLYTIQGAPKAAAATVRQGYVEQSNVNAVGSMVRMITVQRAYEAAAKAVTAQDDSLSKVINEAGRV